MLGKCATRSLQQSHSFQRAPAHLHHANRLCVVLHALPQTKDVDADITVKIREIAGLGDSLGPIGLTIGGDTQESKRSNFGERTDQRDSEASSSFEEPKSIHSMSTAEWRSKYEKEGTIDLWLEEEFNSGSRLVGGRAVHNGGQYGIRTGEGPSVSDAQKHKVKIFDHYANQVVDVEVPEDRYILWEAEDAGLVLPYACRMGCCTVCAVKVKEGELYQPEGLGLSLDLREQGYGLMCVGYPLTDCVLETVPEDEIYDLQFGAAIKGLDTTNTELVERDDYGFSLANMDE